MKNIEWKSFIKRALIAVVIIIMVFVGAKLYQGKLGDFFKGGFKGEISGVKLSMNKVWINPDKTIDPDGSGAEVYIELTFNGEKYRIPQAEEAAYNDVFGEANIRESRELSLSEGRTIYTLTIRVNDYDPLSSDDTLFYNEYTLEEPYEEVAYDYLSKPEDQFCDIAFRTEPIR